MSATEIGRLLNTTVEVQRRRLTADGMGGQIVDWQTIGHLPARVSSPPTSTTAATLAAAQTMERVPFYVYLDPDADVVRGDVLTDDSDGRRLFVESVTWPSIKAYRRAACREWQTEPESVEEAPE